MDISSILSFLSDNGDLAWLAPYAEPFITEVQKGGNPYPIFSAALRAVYYPRVSSTFTGQLWALVGIFCLSIVLIVSGIALRVHQGRLWLVHSIDSRITIPNISLHFLICSGIYCILSIVEIIASIKIVSGANYYSYYIGLQGMMPLILLLGQWSEAWANLSAYTYRRFGTHNDTNLVIVAFFRTLPFVYPVIAILPSIVLFALVCREFGASFDIAMTITEALSQASSDWVPNDMSQLFALTKIIAPATAMVRHILRYTTLAQVAFTYVAAVLMLAFLIYVVTTLIEIGYLHRQSQALRRQCAAQQIVNSGDGRSTSSSFSNFHDTGSDSPAYPTPAVDTSKLESQASLLEWAKTNRLLTALCISLALLVNAGLSLWFSLQPISVRSNNVRFQSIVLVSAWVNSILLLVVNLLILSRSLDGSTSGAQTLLKVLPWLPLPPCIRSNPNEATQARVARNHEVAPGNDRDQCEGDLQGRGETDSWDMDLLPVIDAREDKHSSATHRLVKESDCCEKGAHDRKNAF